MIPWHLLFGAPFSDGEPDAPAEPAEPSGDVLPFGAAPSYDPLPFLDGLDSREALSQIVMISLHSHGRVGNEAGWWADSVDGVRIGSGLWRYRRAALTADTAEAVRREILASLQWMIDDRVAKSVAAIVEADRQAGRLSALVTVTGSRGEEVSARFADLWRSIDG